VDTNTVIVSLVGAVVTVVGVIALLVKSFVADKPKNGNGKGSTSIQAVDIQDTLTIAIQNFREVILENKMRQEDMSKTLSRIEANLMSCSDILKTLPKRSSD
jgi:hypothetical protein